MTYIARRMTYITRRKDCIARRTGDIGLRTTYIGLRMACIGRRKDYIARRSSCRKRHTHDIIPRSPCNACRRPYRTARRTHFSGLPDDGKCPLTYRPGPNRRAK